MFLTVIRLLKLSISFCMSCGSLCFLNNFFHFIKVAKTLLRSSIFSLGVLSVFVETFSDGYFKIFVSLF